MTHHERHATLKAQIETHNLAYHGQDAPIITDAAFDALMTEARALEQIHPDLKPVETVGFPANAAFTKVTHPTRLYSLDNAFNDDGVHDFARVIHDQLGAVPVGYTVEPKVDGLSINLIYSGGHLRQALTRGDGFTGEDVTANVLTIPGVPRDIPHTGHLEVRGEVYMSRAAFEAYNAQAERDGRDQLANARNGAAGALRQKNAADARLRNLSAVFYGLGTHDDSLGIRSQKQLLDFLAAQGFTVSEFNRTVKTIEDAITAHHDLLTQRQTLPMDADGTVIKLGSLSLRQDVGFTSRAPKWAVAYKFPSEEVSTVLEDIIIQTGRTGRLTPVAIVRPVSVEGSVITRATLHNQDFITRLDLRVGDTVTLLKSGGVIPKITGVVPAGSDAPRSPAFAFPTTCPSCGEPAQRDDGRADTYCVNDACDARAFARIRRFGARKVMNILGLGDGIIEALIDQAGVNDPSDLYALDAEQIARLTTTDEQGNPRTVGLKTAEKLTAQIDASRTAGLSRVINSFGFPNVGEGTGERVAKRYATLQEVMQASVEELKTIPDVGDVVARSLHDGLRRPETQAYITRLLDRGLAPTSEQSINSSELAGLTLVLTGTLSQSRDGISKHLEAHGARVTNSITSKTSYLIMGDGGGSKRSKAEKAGVQIITEEGLLALLDDYGVPHY